MTSSKRRNWVVGVAALIAACAGRSGTSSDPVATGVCLVVGFIS